MFYSKVLIFLIFLVYSVVSFSATQKYVLNMKDVDIKSMITTVSGIIKKDIIFNPALSANVTFVSKRSLTKDEVFQAFLSILEFHDFSLLPTSSKNTFKVVTSINFKSRAIPNDFLGLKKGDQLVTRLFSLKHVKVLKLVEILQPLVSENAYLAAYEDTKMIVISDTAINIRRLEEIVTRFDVPIVESVDTVNVVYLKFAQASDLSSMLQRILKVSDKNRLSDSVYIDFDDISNSLVIKSTPEKFLMLKKVVNKLDIPRAQVHIEAVLAEVSFNLEKELGINWTTRSSSSGSGVFASVQDGLSLKDIFTMSFFKGSDLQAIVKVLESDTDSNILSTPSLLTMDNHEASIIIGENVPFITGTQQSQDGLANPYQTIVRKDVGLTLKIKPRINQGGSIVLDIYQEVSNVLPKTQSVGAVDLITRKRAIQTTVTVENDGMVVLGGLIQDTLVNNVNKVPVLGDIPIIGNLFKSSKVETIKSNLMVFIRPTILTNSVLANDMAQEKYAFIQDKQIQLRGKGVRLLEEKAITVLPDLSDKKNSNKLLEVQNPFFELQLL